jgi:hypothetical protein
MKPKEKAEELYTHMFECVINPEVTQLEMETMAISSALIAVDEILKMVDESMQGFLDSDIIAYWKQVKTEIEKL